MFAINNIADVSEQILEDLGKSMLLVYDWGSKNVPFLEVALLRQ
jgi:hypothetical protein